MWCPGSVCTRNWALREVPLHRGSVPGGSLGERKGVLRVRSWGSLYCRGGGPYVSFLRFGRGGKNERTQVPVHPLDRPRGERPDMGSRLRVLS